MEGLPEAVRPGCRSVGDAAGFAEALVSLLRLTPAERRLAASRADLGGLSWSAQLAPMLALVDRAGRSRRQPG
jgi:hypothetical protein